MNRCASTTWALCVFLVTALIGAQQESAFAPVSRLPSEAHSSHYRYLRYEYDEPALKNVGDQPSTALLAEPQFGDPDYEGDPTGLKRGAILLPIIFLINVWLFSIPVEFRRARLCSEEEVRANPNSKCMTWETWRSGVADYYASGGGVKFDFSIDPDASSSATGL
mmetsp:Transcript_25135/g.54865  ORF Transcript_25135/g.54865 Transcript_25135/m.54865 type:complete len:165 (-) Transcript_25135:47-541(-)